MISPNEYLCIPRVRRRIFVFAILAKINRSKSLQYPQPLHSRPIIKYPHRSFPNYAALIDRFFIVPNRFSPRAPAVRLFRFHGRDFERPRSRREDLAKGWSSLRECFHCEPKPNFSSSDQNHPVTLRGVRAGSRGLFLPVFSRPLSSENGAYCPSDTNPRLLTPPFAEIPFPLLLPRFVRSSPSLHVALSPFSPFALSSTRSLSLSFSALLRIPAR